MRRLVLLLTTALLLVVAATVPSPVAAKSHRCSGKILGKYPVVTIRGVSCTYAKRTASRFIRSRAPLPWHCGLAHAPFRRIAGVKIGASCGYGPSVYKSTSLTARRHAFAIGAP